DLPYGKITRWHRAIRRAFADHDGRSASGPGNLERWPNRRRDERQHGAGSLPDRNRSPRHHGREAGRRPTATFGILARKHGDRISVRDDTAVDSRTRVES